MHVSWKKQAFVYAAVGVMLLAIQSQSCSASGGRGVGPDPRAPQGTAPATAAGNDISPQDGRAGPAPVETPVAIVRSGQPSVAQITQAEIDSMVRRAVDLVGGLSGLIHDGQTVVIKPNLVQPFDFTGGPRWAAGPYLTPEANGVTTDYRVTRSVVQLVREHNPSGEVYVMEGTAGNGSPTNRITSTVPVFQALNYTPEYIPGVDAFVAIEADSAEPGGYQMVTVPNGRLGNSYAVNTRYLKADVLISLPTMKTHYMATVTGAVKNVGIGATPANYYGRPNFPDPDYADPLLRTATIDHESIALHHFIHDFYLARPVDFVVMDGLQGMQNGPTPCTEVSGTTHISQDQMNMRLILAGADAVAVDAIESLIMGWDPASVEHLSALHETGAGTIDTANIRVLGARVDQVRKTFDVPTKDFAYGGEPITDVTPPVMKVVDPVQVADDRLRLGFQVNGDLEKVEVYLNQKRIEPTFTTGFEAISMDVSHLPGGTYDLVVIGYDDYLNASLESLPGSVVLP